MTMCIGCECEIVGLEKSLKLLDAAPNSDVVEVRGVSVGILELTCTNTHTYMYGLGPKCWLVETYFTTLFVKFS